MKIYEIGTGYTPIPAQMGAATEIVVEELTRSFLDLGEKVEILDIVSDDRSETDLPILEIKVPAFFAKKDVSLGLMHKMKRVFYSVSLALKIKSLLKENKEKVFLHFHNQYNMFFYLKLVPEKLRKKAVTAYTVHSYIWGTDWEEIKETVKRRYFQEIECVKNADAVLVLNDITAEHFVGKLGVDACKIHKIINGVNLKKYKNLSDAEINRLKVENGFEGKKIIFQVGSVCDRKNQFGSVKMLVDYLKKNRDVIYLYAGGVIDSEYHQSIAGYASEKGIENQVVYAGELAPGKTLNEYYNMADCSIFTSKLESFGLVIIEAIASGTPVVVGSKPLFDLKSGYLLYNDENQFVSQVDFCMKGEQCAKCDSAEVLGRYNWEAVAKKHMEIVRSVEERQ